MICETSYGLQGVQIDKIWKIMDIIEDTWNMCRTTLTCVDNTSTSQNLF